MDWQSDRLPRVTATSANGGSGVDCYRSLWSVTTFRIFLLYTGERWLVSLSNVRVPGTPVLWTYWKCVVPYRSQLYAIFDCIYKSKCYHPDLNLWYPAHWAKRRDRILIAEGQKVDEGQKVYSLWRRANARNVSFLTRYDGQFTISTWLI